MKIPNFEYGDTYDSWDSLSWVRFQLFSIRCRILVTWILDGIIGFVESNHRRLDLEVQRAILDLDADVDESELDHSDRRKFLVRRRRVGVVPRRIDAADRLSVAVVVRTLLVRVRWLLIRKSGRNSGVELRPVRVPLASAGTEPAWLWAHHGPGQLVSQ